MFILEGNIGTGKTTMLSAIQKFLPHVSVHFEGVSQWQKKNNGLSILEKFYTNPQRWSYSMEIASLTTRIPEYFALQKKQGFHVIERSVYSGLHCFALNDYESNFLQSIEWTMFKQWFDFAIQKCTPPKGFIYLHASPCTSYQRIKNRNRTEEKTVPLEYIERIHKKHEDFLVNKKNIHQSIRNTPVLILDCNVDLIKNTRIMNEYLKKIEQFIQTSNSKITLHYKSDACQL